MAYNFRSGRTLTCFYCGGRSAQKLRGKIHKWKCSQCEAVNHLDEQGVITEPPPSSPSVARESSKKTPRYARSVSPDNQAAPDVFCATCLKNQHLLTQNLASYLPAEDHPSYASHLASFDQYKKKLEQRYPPVCGNCAPKAREQIKKSARLAQTDHLRRLMKKTRDGAIDWKRQGRWRGLVFRVAGFGWVSSLVAQAFWHITCVMAIEIMEATRGADIGDDGELTMDMDPRESAWTQMLLNNRSHVLRYQALITSWMTFVLLTGAATFWWNAKMRRKYLGVGGKMTGLAQYYAISVLVSAIRYAAWILFGNQDALLLYKSHMLFGMHVFMAAFLLLFTLTSQSLVKIVQPKVSFHITDDMILPDAPGAPAISSTPTSATQPPNSLRSNGNRNSLTGFPVNKLGTPQRPSSSRSFGNDTPQHRNSQIPTPPPDQNYDDSDAMDWTPSSTHASLFNPRPQRAVPAQHDLNSGPSPFYGSIPRAPPTHMSQSRLPPQQASELPNNSSFSPFRMASWRDQENFHKTVQQHQNRGVHNRAQSIMTDDDNTTDGGYESDRTTRANDDRQNRRGSGQEMHLRAPRFFPAGDTVDTGLEVMFDQVFSMSDYVDGNSIQDDEGRRTKTPTAFNLPPKTNGDGSIDGDEMANSPSLGSYLLIAGVPAAILGFAVVVVKGLG